MSNHFYNKRIKQYLQNKLVGKPSGFEKYLLYLISGDEYQCPLCFVVPGDQKMLSHMRRHMRDMLKTRNQKYFYCMPACSVSDEGARSCVVKGCSFEFKNEKPYILHHKFRRHLLDHSEAELKAIGFS